VCAAHTDEQLDRTLTAFRKAADVLQGYADAAE
jgi:glutamate-1-semialdehyde aminotransferase